MATEWKQVIPSRSQYDEHGLRIRKLSRGFCHVRIGFSADPLKDDDWARRHAMRYGGFQSAMWQMEQGINYKARGGQRIWPMLSDKFFNAVTDIKGWTLFRIIDQGIRHPTVCLWVAVNARGDRHFYREYYATDRSIAMNCRQILQLSEDERISGNYIDPATRKRNPQTLKMAITVYEENKLYCETADNSFAGYDKVREGAISTLCRHAIRTGDMPDWLRKLEPTQDELTTLAAKPAITFDLRFTSRAFEECCNLRWRETQGDATQKAAPEKPMDKEDDGPDCVRYAVQSPLFYRKPEQKGIGLKMINFRELHKKQVELRERKEREEKRLMRAYT